MAQRWYTATEPSGHGVAATFPRIETLNSAAGSESKPLKAPLLQHLKLLI
jgi:hypothetical protein